MVGELILAGCVGYFGYFTGEVVRAYNDYKICKTRQLEENYRKSIEEPPLTEKCLKIGYENFGGYKKPIIVDMDVNPHMLVCGLSNQGKSKMVEYAIKDKKCILMNIAKDDFISVRNAKRINDLDEITSILSDLLETGEQPEPLFIIMDEILSLVLSGNGKKINELLGQMLAFGRHKNIYIIALTQTAEKEILKFKYLFNNRVCFKMLDDAAYKVVLGKSPEQFYLSHRQFCYVTDKIGTGYTYDL